MLPSKRKISVDLRESVGWVTLDNAEHRNALSREMWRSLGEAVERLGADDSVRVIVVRGAGGVFCSGAEIGELEQTFGAPARISNHEARTSIGILQRLEKPLVAMIRGYCIGGGLAVALAADVRIAGPDASFSVPAATFGLGYGYAGLSALAQLVGPSSAKDLVFSARSLDAEEALRIGLINRIVPDEHLEAEVAAYARRISENAPLTIRAAKVAIREWQRDPGERDMALVQSLHEACAGSEDHREALRARSQRRRPVFLGR
jgi:enoyl-CoA hydratase/carnithine racemase